MRTATGAVGAVLLIVVVCYATVVWNACGVPADRIILDYEGTRTLNSIVKAKEVYRLDSVTIISQKYHNSLCNAVCPMRNL